MADARTWHLASATPSVSVLDEPRLRIFGVDCSSYPAGKNMPLGTMCHNVKPLFVPAQHSCPHLVRLIRFDLFPEGALDPAQDRCRFVRQVRCLELVAKKQHDQVATGYVKVREVCRVRLVQVDVAFCERRATRRDCWK